MAVKTVALAACVACLLQTQMAHAQSVTAEAAVSAGMSTDEVSAAGVQVRAFGDVKGGVRYFGELAWANTSEPDSDFFGSAYPYRNQVQIIEAYGERMFKPRQAIVGVRAGRFRTPFGIYNASDHAYTGFLRAPFFRYDEHGAVSNNFLEHGVSFVVGDPRLNVETAFGAPADVGTAVRRSGLDAMVRVQGYYGPFIVGVSHMRTPRLESVDVEDEGRSDFTGIDFRWTHSGIQARGEWMTGHPAEGATTNSWYADALIHRVGMGPVTAVVRLERIESEGVGESGGESGGEASWRQVYGARVRLLDALSLTVNIVHRAGQLEVGDESGSHLNTLDVGFTWSVRRSSR